MKNNCCYLYEPIAIPGSSDLRVPCCPKEARWQIIDLDELDPYSRDTYTCEEHLQELLPKNCELHFIEETEDAQLP